MATSHTKICFFAQIKKLTVFNNSNISQNFPNIIHCISMQKSLISIQRNYHNGAKLEIKV